MKETEKDENLKKLKEITETGWPEKKKIPKNLEIYYSVRNDITEQGGLLYKDSRLIVPESLRDEFMVLAHQSHGGIGACLRRMRETIYWPGMTTCMKQKIRDCETCKKYQESQLIKNPLISHDIGSTPWSKIGVDLCYLNDRTLLVVTDYYSNYLTVRRIPNQYTQNVTNELLGIFATHGLPETIICDNGPQFRDKFYDFAREYDINVTTTSPYFPQSNGKAENAVKTIKRMFKKCREEKISEQMALLNFNNTPSEGINLSPSQRLFGRRCRTMLPITKTMLQTRHEAEKEKELIKKGKNKQAFYFNKDLKLSPEFEEGEAIRIKRPREEGWTKGKCLGEVAPRSHIVEIENKMYRRNVRDIRKDATGNNKEAVSDLTKEDSPNLDVEPLRRSTRITKIPSRFL